MSEDRIWRVAQSVGFDDYELRPMLEAFAAIAQQAQEPVGDRYFSYSTDLGFEEYPTRDEAIECANIQIKHYREDAIRDDEWPDEVDSVCWGVILGRSKEIDTSNEDHESVDYKLHTTPPSPQPAPADERAEFEADMADKAAVMPTAVVAEVYQSRYTIEWVNGPMPLGTNLYAGPKVVKAWAEEVRKLRAERDALAALQSPAPQTKGGEA